MNKKEIISVIAIGLILSFAFSIRNFSMRIFPYTLLAVFLVLTTNIVGKKLASYYLEAEIEIKIWQVKRWGFRAHQYFKKSFPAGIFLPIITAAFSFGYFIWLACFSFDVKARIYRAAKRHGLYSFTEMSESHIGLIAASGIAVNLILAVISYFAGWDFFTRLNIYYAFFNMLPVSDLDGNKLFFGNMILWSFLASLVLVAMAYAFLVV